MVVSLNFAFLESHGPQLVRVGALAEQYFITDPNTSLIENLGLKPRHARVAEEGFTQSCA